MTVLVISPTKTGARGIVRHRLWLRRRASALRGALPLVLTLLALIAASRASADAPVRGRVKAYTDGGYARLIFRFDEAVPATTRISDSVLVINFSKPVDVSVDHLNDEAPDYISAARRDPDGTAIRIALRHKVKFNTIPAGERLYVDMLPESWVGMLPGVPQEVIDELAQRATRAEKELHEQRAIAKVQPPPLIRVRVAHQPTFIRYVFAMPESANVVPARNADKLILSFDQNIRWDLADAIAALPPSVISITNRATADSAIVTFAFMGNPELHTFREGHSVIVDVVTGSAAAPAKEDAVAKAAAALEATISSQKDLQQDHDKATAPAKMQTSAPDTKMMKPVMPSKAQPVDAVKSEPAAAMAPAKRADPAMNATAQASSPAVKPPVTKPPAMKETKPPAMKEMAAPDSAPAAGVGAAQEKAAAAVAAPAAPKTPAMAMMPTQKPAIANPNAPLVVGLRQSSDRVQLDFPFVVPTTAAVFRRADTLWLVFDSAANLDLSAVNGAADQRIRNAVFERAPDGAAIVRIKLSRPQLASAVTDGPSWSIAISDTAIAPTQPLNIVRSGAGAKHAGIAIPFDHPGTLHQLHDSDAGDRLMVITASAPVRGLLKQQDFIELRALESTQGVVVHPIADDVSATLEADRITISRPVGLSLSLTTPGQHDMPSYRAMTFDTQLWGFDRNAPFVSRQSELIQLAAGAPETERRKPRLDLARFYLARGMEAEAKGVIDVALADQRGANDVTGNILKAVANVMLDRPGQALKDLAPPEVSTQQDAPVWRAVALAREGKWTEAREAFKKLDDIIAALPLELERIALREELRADIQTRDYTGATRILNIFQTIGISSEIKASIQVLSGQLNEGLGRSDAALVDYRAAAASSDRPAAVQGRLREIELMAAHGSMTSDDVVKKLETLTTVWRGDETEVEGLKLLAHLYTEEGRYRDAFHVMRTAMLAHPNSGLTSQIQDEAARTFDSLFLDGKGDALPPIEALGLFYDFRELTPVGRRGDEMIRRLADRLVSVDLLVQAAELLQHQVDHRLQGAARAQVATKLAVIYLMNRQPDRALLTLQRTRTSELSNELRDQRLLLEARALSDQGRHDVALDLIVNVQGRLALRLRSDILWASRRWRESAEQIEQLYGERWREFTPLNVDERADILRVAIGYALGDDTIGLARLREKYAAKMAEGGDRRAFDIVSAPIGTNADEFQDIAKRVAATNTLTAFLREMRARYPDLAPIESPKVTSKAKLPEPPPKVEKPQAFMSKPVDHHLAANYSMSREGISSSPLPDKPPTGLPLTPDMTPTGSITVLSRMLSPGR